MTITIFRQQGIAACLNMCILSLILRDSIYQKDELSQKLTGEDVYINSLSRIGKPPREGALRKERAFR
jgi:hypothetical protein